jgi:predicted transcriptional regulator
VERSEKRVSRTLVLELSDEEYARLQRLADATGRTPAEAVRGYLREVTLPPEASESARAAMSADVRAAIRAMAEQVAAESGRTPEAVEAEFRASLRPRQRPPLSPAEWQAAGERLRRHSGAVRSGMPHSSNNARIDEELAREGSTPLKRDRASGEG